MDERDFAMIGTIEDAILKRLNDVHASGVLGYKLKKIASYGGEFADGLENIVRDFPALLVIYGGAVKTAQTNNNIGMRHRWMVICCAKSLRNEQESRQGAENKVGSYQMAEDVAMLLGNQDFKLPIGKFSVDGIRALANDKASQQLASIYGVDISTILQTSTVYSLETHEAAGNNIGDFETFHANWDIPVHGNVAEPLPSDEKADATDHIKLEKQG